MGVNAPDTHTHNPLHFPENYFLSSFHIFNINSKFMEYLNDIHFVIQF